MAPMVGAFRSGMASVLRLEWLEMFDHRELQTLISGTDHDIDVDDMRANTLVHSPSTSVSDAAVEDVAARLWRCVKRMTRAQRQALLKFVTGCSRPPLMGFKVVNTL